jgi:hypothetical protein
MISNLPIWFQLIKKKSDNKETGLTIPFIVGAMSVCEIIPIQSISVLINEIINNKHSKVALYFCGERKEYILTVNPIFLPPPDYVFLQEGNLLIHESKINGAFLSGITDISYIIEALTLFYQKHIKDNEYSLIGHDWQYYTAADIKFIKDTLNCIQ